MKKLVYLVALFVVSLTLSLGMVRLSMGFPGLRSPAARPPPKEPPPIVYPQSPADLCDRGFWRHCIEAAETEPARRGVYLRRADRLLDHLCHPRPGVQHIGPCGELALMRVERSPRQIPVALECLEHAIRECDWKARHEGGCDLVSELPRELLDRPEWQRWCARGDEVACRIEQARIGSR